MGIQINGQTDTVTAIDGSLNVGGDVIIPGVLTYDDVTNVDSIGVITARSGIYLDRFIYHSGDLNTSFGFPNDATDTFTVNTSSVERLRVESGGNIGIGTNDPNNLLHVYGGQIKAQSNPSDTSTNLDLIRAQCGSSGNALFSIRAADAADNNSNWDIKTNANEDLTFTIGGATEGLRITSSGNIGISSISPTEKLDVDGNIKLSGRFQEKMPADFWSQDQSFYCISDGDNKLGNITHQGSYRVHITSNGYRNATSSQWTSYGVNSFTGASSIGVDPTGIIIFGTESNKANGSAANVTERVRIDDDRMTFAQDRRLRFAPNSNWGAGLNVGGNGNAADTTYGSMVVTNGNLHLDAREGAYGIYLNWYGGTNGTYFGNGSSQQRGRIDGSGNLTLSGSYPGSDLRLKENIETITGATDTIKALVGKTFTWKPEAGLDSYKRYGFIAQEVQQVVPDLVKAIGCHYFDADDNLIDSIDPTESDEDREAAGLTRSLTVNNEGVTPILVEAMKELIAKVETLETRISTLEGN